MNLTRKLQKAFELRTFTQSSALQLLKAPVANYVAWRDKREADRVRSVRARLTPDYILHGVDRDELQRIRTRYSSAGDRPDVFWTKYLDVDKWLAVNVRYANKYGLIAHPPRRVLDLGCGGGYFLLVCRSLGSRVLGLDLDKDRALNDLIAVFKLKRIAWEIRAFVPLPKTRRKFDLITAFMICFNFPTGQPAWGPAEWDYLLNDVSSRLTRHGRVILGLNRDLVDGTLYNDELKSYFEARGASVDGKHIVFSQADLVRTKSLRQTEACHSARD